MAVEARQFNPFASQIGNRDMIGAVEADASVYNNPLIYGLPPLSGTTDPLFPMYNCARTDSLPAKTAMKADSGLTYALPVSRKRSRDSISPLNSFLSGQIQTQNSNRCGSFTFLGEDMSLQIQQQQQEIDRFIAQHTEKVRLEVEERRQRYARRIVAAVEEGILKRLRAKEEEIEKIGKLNWALEERVKSLCLENQIWRDLAQTNEATANALRSNLELVLQQAKVEPKQRGSAVAEAAVLADDAQSCCGSNYGGTAAEWRTGAVCGGGGKAEKVEVNDDCTGSSVGNNRLCRHCRKEESCVLLLPRRHLCLCTVCGSSVHTCPVCNTAKNASVHVIISS